MGALGNLVSIIDLEIAGGAGEEEGKRGEMKKEKIVHACTRRRFSSPGHFPHESENCKLFSSRSSTRPVSTDITGDPEIPAGHRASYAAAAAADTASRNIPPYGDPMAHPPLRLRPHNSPAVAL